MSILDPMSMEGIEATIRDLEKLKKSSQTHIKKAIERNVKIGVNTAKVLAPEDTGETIAQIVPRFYRNGLIGVIQAVSFDETREIISRQLSIEKGRKKSKGRDDRKRGTSAPFFFISRMRISLRKRWRNSMRRALQKAIRESFRG